MTPQRNVDVLMCRPHSFGVVELSTMDKALNGVVHIYMCILSPTANRRIGLLYFFLPTANCIFFLPTANCFFFVFVSSNLLPAN